MMNFQIILNLFLLEKILSITYCLSQQLQGVDLDIVNASSLIRSTKSAIEALRSQDSFDGIFNSAEKFADDFNISSSNSIGSATLSYAKSPRIRQVSVKLKEFFVTSTIGNRHSDHHEPATEDENAIHVSFRYNVYIPVLDRILAEYDRRFSNNLDVFDCICAVDPLHEKFLANEWIGKFCSCFQSKVSKIFYENIDDEITCAKNLLSSTKKAQTTFELYEISNQNKIEFKGLLCLIIIALTIPVTTSSYERFFSTSKCVMSYFRYQWAMIDFEI